MQKRKIIYQLWRDLYAVYVFLFVYVIGWARSRLHYPCHFIHSFIHSLAPLSVSIVLVAYHTLCVCVWVCVAAVFDFQIIFPFWFWFWFHSIFIFSFHLSLSWFFSCSFFILFFALLISSLILPVYHYSSLCFRLFFFLYFIVAILLLLVFTFFDYYYVIHGFFFIASALSLAFSYPFAFLCPLKIRSKLMRTPFQQIEIRHLKYTRKRGIAVVVLLNVSWKRENQKKWNS